MLAWGIGAALASLGACAASSVFGVVVGALGIGCVIAALGAARTGLGGEQDLQIGPERLVLRDHVFRREQIRGAEAGRDWCW